MATTIQLFQSADGKRWRLAGTDESGRLFVPAHLDPANVKRWVWAKEADLVQAVGAMTPLEHPIEDPHDSELHHPYLLGRDLPPMQEAKSRADA
ncbi:hypothetical protein AB0D12_32030 [Streptomyces sp. NPDC048479]|uniref:hypothetical protein n=1 Tax=Streptomyces sp. NPDC048479 TaxID=3154725 RepID=UPI00341A1397